MKFCRELVENSNFEDKKALLELSEHILKSMDSIGIKYIDENFEKVAENHIVELSIRILNDAQIQDAETPFDRSQVNEEAWGKAAKINEDLKQKFGTKLTNFETFLIATHFMLNA